MSLTVFGSLNYDLVTRASVFPKGGETLHADDFETHHGGKGANQALALRRLSPASTEVKMIGRVGNDTFGHELKQSMTKEGIDMTEVTVVDSQRTGVATIFVESGAGENRILVYPGANGSLAESDVSASLFEGSKMLILQNEIPLPVVYKSLEVAHNAGITTVYNPSPVDAAVPRAVFSNVDFLIVNSSEAQTLAKSADINDSVDAAQTVIQTLAKSLGCKHLVITLGANGSVYYTNGASGHVAAAKVAKIVDTTGAGDTFLGGFCGKIAGGASIPDALAFAAKAAAIAVTRRGAAEGIPLLNEVA